MAPDLEEYIEHHIDREPDELHAIDRRTNVHLLNGRMCSGHSQGRLLKMLTRMVAPGRVLEVGTFSGYSSLCIAEGLPEGGTVDTIEIDDELEDFILRSLGESPHGHKVRLHIGNALEVCKGWAPETFDMIFMDGDKREYRRYYEALMPLLKPGGYLLADNTLWDGHVLEENPKSPQTRGIREFNDFVAADCGVEKVIIPVRDGITVIRKND